ncbi:MAG: GNAT family N-acetyltransferase [Candidatus Eremiobacteraeota bacterium]|nr:GNAT family N-acetyltransferase [Candidatus Eremiobacteraeota bacterium]
MIRTAVLADSPAVARVHVDAWRTSYTKILPSAILDNLSYDEREKLWRDIIGARDIRRVFVAVDEGSEIVGFAACGPNRTGDPRYPGELYAIYLLAERRGSGFGRALFDAVSAYLREQELTPFQIWTIAGDERVERFYEALGGRRVASQPTVVEGANVNEHAYGFAMRA